MKVNAYILTNYSFSGAQRTCRLENHEHFRLSRESKEPYGPWDDHEKTRQFRVQYSRRRSIRYIWLVLYHLFESVYIENDEIIAPRSNGIYLPDIRLVFENCLSYNRPSSAVYSAAENLYQKFEAMHVKDFPGQFNFKRSPTLEEKQVLLFFQGPNCMVYLLPFHQYDYHPPLLAVPMITCPINDG